MTSLKARWQKLAGRFNALLPRERAMVAAALVAGLLFGGLALAVDPLLAQAKTAQRQVEQKKAELLTVQAQLAALKSGSQLDPDAAKKAEIAALRAELAGVDATLRKLEVSLVPPARMNVVLEQLLARHPSLRLVSFKTLPPDSLAQRSTEAGKAGEKIAAATADAVAPIAFDLYKHGVELRLEGSYADLYAWLAQLEAAPQKLLWGELVFSVLEYPKSQLALTVYTLSSDTAWLAL